MNPSTDNSWERLVSAARRRRDTGPTAPAAEAPPPGFAARLAARWTELRQNETFRLWCRWSLIAALAGLIIAAIVAFLPAPLPPDAHPLSVPAVETPALSPR